MKIKFMHKDIESGTGACPAMYEAPGGFVFQGKKVGADVYKQARDFAPDEELVYVAQNVLDQYVEKVLESR